jgi:hypothetical protein
MGASAREIEQQIKETRERMDENLGVLEDRAASGVQRYGRIAAVVVGVAAVSGVGFLVWRRMREPAPKSRLDRLSPRELRALADQVSARLKKSAPSVTVTVNEADHEPGMLQSILSRVMPDVVGTASSALIERAGRSRKESAAS